MRYIFNLYLLICRRFGPMRDGRRLTVSAWAWVHAQETGDRWWRNRIDGAALFFRGEEQHCQQQYQRETRNHQPQKAP